ncbi:hypothetical protein [Rickettsia rhipicephali]|nr:hypothetical protein [Rickettsia rhipicephali]
MSILNIGFYKYQGNKIIYMFICIWFLSWAIIGYNIRKLNKNAIILKIINKIGAVTIWSIIALVYYYIGLDKFNKMAI